MTTEAHGVPTGGTTPSSPQEVGALVKSRQRVIDHGEVFTPSWMVDDMLDLVKEESERIDSRFLEPACGSGNFLVPVLSRKLATVEARYGKSEFEKRHFALLGLMCVYGIELLEDNAAECRVNLLGVFADYLKVSGQDVWYRAAEAVLAVNIVRGDALSMTTATDAPRHPMEEAEPITFPEWGYIGKGLFQRRDFRYDRLTQMTRFEEGSLFADFETHQIFAPSQEYPPMTVDEIANA